jgi:hypothetical protein
MTVISKTKNKVYVRTATAEKTIAGTSHATKPIELYTLEDITVQADKALKFTVYTNYLSPVYSWGGLYIGMSIKIGTTWYDCGDGGYSCAAMAERASGHQSYTHSVYIDFIDEGIVPAGGEYTIGIVLIGKTYDSTGYISPPSSDVNGDDMGNHGIELEDIMKQNYTSVIVQEKDRWA